MSFDGDLWRELEEGPLFALTSDQDWCPSWAAERFLEELRALGGIPTHVFRTSPCDAFDRTARSHEITQGWHPNFLPSSSHGSSIEEVIGYFHANFPGLRTLRTHCYYENSFVWSSLATAGIKADSQVVTLYQPRLMPLRHWTGIWRLPVFFEDDVFFDLESRSLDLAPVLESLFSPGLKILNFHATFVAFNIPARPYYEQNKQRIFSGADPQTLVWGKRGTREVFRDLVDRIRSRGHGFISFESVVDRLLGPARPADCPS
jgi:hypothetical protein